MTQCVGSQQSLLCVRTSQRMTEAETRAQRNHPSQKAAEVAQRNAGAVLRSFSCARPGEPMCIRRQRNLFDIRPW